MAESESEIKVYVIRNKQRENLVIRYLDPQTGKPVDRSAKSSSPKQAAMAAAVWEDELRNGRYAEPSRTAWEQFCERFESDGVSGMNGTTFANYASTLRAFEELCNPRGIADLTTARVSQFARELRTPYQIAYCRGKQRRTRTAVRSEATVARHQRHLRAVAPWAHRYDYRPSLSKDFERSHFTAWLSTPRR